MVGVQIIMLGLGYFYLLGTNKKASNYNPIKTTSLLFHLLFQMCHVVK